MRTKEQLRRKIQRARRNEIMGDKKKCKVGNSDRRIYGKEDKWKGGEMEWRRGKGEEVERRDAMEER